MCIRDRLYTADVLRLMCYDATEQSVHNVRTRLINFFLLYIKDRDTPVVPLSQEQMCIRDSSGGRDDHSPPHLIHLRR